MFMIVLEIVLVFIIIAIVLFGKIEISSSSFSVALRVGGYTLPLISIVGKKNQNTSI